ncbi:MAG: hypothetical protein EXR73_01060 [Myxococcales bacterium]|nr:hypothetical protein [Myxococcales bacterium]
MPTNRLRAWLPLIVAAIPLVAWSAQQVAPKVTQRPFAELSTRGSTRIFYWGGNSSGGQLEIHYGQPPWKAEYDAAIPTLSGQRWRLGQNFWTTLDTNIDLELADVEILAGCYYLALERNADGSFVLWVLDPVEIRDAHLDAFLVKQTTGGIAIPLAYKSSPVLADKLQIRLDVEPNVKDRGKFVLHFGSHELSASLTMAPARD